MADRPNPENVGVAEYDQLHAEAIDALRAAPTFFLAVPVVQEDEEGELRPTVVVRGGGVGFDSFLLTVAASLNARTWESVAAHLQKGQRLRRFMLVAAGANVVLVVYNVARLAS